MTNNSDTVTTTAPPKVDIQPADMRALLDRQRASFLADGIPTYDARIDRLDRLITMLVDNKDEINRDPDGRFWDAQRGYQSICGSMARCGESQIL
jgi:hypothetical protein